MDETDFAAVIQDVREGCTVSFALKKREIPASSFYAFRAKDPMRVESLARARRDMTHALVDAAIDIVDTEPDPKRGKVRAEARLRVAAMLNPREFGARLDLVVTPGADPRQLHDEGLQRARLMRDLQPLALAQPIEDAVIVDAGSTDGQSVAAPSIFD